MHVAAVVETQLEVEAVADQPEQRRSGLGVEVLGADRPDQVERLLGQGLGLPAVQAAARGDLGEDPAVDVAELADRRTGAAVDAAVDPDRPGVGALGGEAVEDLGGAVAVAERLEQHGLVPALLDGVADDVVAAELEPLEGPLVVLVVDLDGRDPARSRGRPCWCPTAGRPPRTRLAPCRAPPCAAGASARRGRTTRSARAGPGRPPRSGGPARHGGATGRARPSRARTLAEDERSSTRPRSRDIDIDPLHAFVPGVGRPQTEACTGRPAHLTSVGNRPAGAQRVGRVYLTLMMGQVTLTLKTSTRSLPVSVTYRRPGCVERERRGAAELAVGGARATERTRGTGRSCSAR